MPAAFQATFTINGDVKSLNAFKEEMAAVLAKENEFQNFQEQYVSQDLVYRFEGDQGIPFPPFVATSLVFPDLAIKVQWINRRDDSSGSAVIQNGKLIDQDIQPLPESEPAGTAIQTDIAVEKDGYLKHAIVFKNTGAGEYAGYILTGDQHALFKIRKHENRIELYSSDGLEAEWKEYWSYESESGKRDHREMVSGEKIGMELYRELEVLVDDFIDDWLWFSESPLEDIIIEQKNYERMGLAAHQANIKSEKFKKMSKPQAGRDDFYRFSSLQPDCAWVKTAIEACWAAA